ncbi:MAG: LamG domain-containing protein [Candidatus Peregrinibacteria bacterium]
MFFVSLQKFFQEHKVSLLAGFFTILGVGILGFFLKDALIPNPVTEQNATAFLQKDLQMALSGNSSLSHFLKADITSTSEGARSSAEVPVQFPTQNLTPGSILVLRDSYPTNTNIRYAQIIPDPAFANASPAELIPPYILNQEVVLFFLELQNGKIRVYPLKNLWQSLSAYEPFTAFKPDAQYFLFAQGDLAFTVSTPPTDSLNGILNGLHGAPDQSPSPAPSPETLCTQDYVPVCGEVSYAVPCPTGETCPAEKREETFSNACELKKAEAMLLHEGECGETKGLVGYWKMDGNFLNTVSGAADLFSNTVTPEFVAGKINSSLHFLDGNTKTAWSAGDAPFGNEVTLSAWFKADNTEGFSKILQLGATENSSAGIAIDSPEYQVRDGVRYWLTISGKRYESIARPDLNYHDGNWHQAVMAYDGNAVRLYIDGKEESAKRISGPLDASKSLYIGSAPEDLAGDMFTGNIDGVRLFERGLSTSEVQREYEQQ